MEMENIYTHTHTHTETHSWQQTHFLGKKKKKTEKIKLNIITPLWR